MKVLISGYYGFYNIGDEAILKSIIEALRNEDPNIDIVVLSNDVEYTKNTYKVNAINRWKLNEIYKELESLSMIAPLWKLNGFSKNELN